MENQETLKNVKALTFDVFGTVVDWRGSVAREIKAMGDKKGFQLDWEKFADEWRNGYGPSMDKVRSGEIEIAKVGGKINVSDALTKHVPRDDLEKHIESANMMCREGRHAIAPAVARDEITGILRSTTCRKGITSISPEGI